MKSQTKKPDDLWWGVSRFPETAIWFYNNLHQDQQRSTQDRILAGLIKLKLKHKYSVIHELTAEDKGLDC